MHRSLVLALTLAVGAVACADRSQGAASPQAETSVTPPPAAFSEQSRNIQTPETPPAIPPSLAPPPEPAAPPPAPTQAKTDGEPTDVDYAQEARDEARANAKNNEKWKKEATENDRKATYEWANDRLQKEIERVAQVQNKLSRIPQARRGKFNNDLNVFNTKKSSIQSMLGSLSATGNDQWKKTKAELDRQLDDLDGAANTLDGDLY